MSKVEDFLSHLYSSNQREAYEIVLGLVKEVESLNKQLVAAKAPNPEPHVVNMADFDLMISMSIREYVNRKFPVTISNRNVSTGHEPHVFMIETFVGYLTKNELLRKPVKFDYRR